jgi:hypothetical protein
MKQRKWKWTRIEDIPAGARVTPKFDLPPELREAFYRKLGFREDRAAELAARDNGTWRPDVLDPESEPFIPRPTRSRAGAGPRGAAKRESEKKSAGQVARKKQ